MTRNRPDDPQHALGRGVRCIAALLLCVAGHAGAACPPAGHGRTALEALAANGFELADDTARQALAIGLLDCLADPDPRLRDGVAFEALARWLRAGTLDTTTRQQLLDRLLPQLAQHDPHGFAAPFAALVLAELVRSERMQPWMHASARARVTDAAARYLAGIRDHRGFDDRVGWRHGVAHGADLVLQLALLPDPAADDLRRLREAVASQVAPPGHAYIHGEPLRLARATWQIARSAAFDADDWTRWLLAVAAPAPLAAWSDAFGSEAGLARRHDVLAFLSMLYLLAQEGGDAGAAARVLPGLRQALAQMP